MTFPKILLGNLDIHHLLYLKGRSVNDAIDPGLCTVTNTSFEAFAMIRPSGQRARTAG